MNKSIIHFLLFAIVSMTVAAGTPFQWQPDVLGAGFQMRKVQQPDDELGAARSTEIRHLVPVDSLHRGVLYIHGFNDYFFQKEMAVEFVEHEYNFFAVDLRRYGRSLMPGQRPFDIRSLDDYFPDIDSAIVDMQRIGITDITLMGHSTGGLIASYYMAVRRPDAISTLILNSPFLDWNLGSKEWLIPLVVEWGRWFPDTDISQDASTAYAESLLKSAHGEWTFNTGWKKVQSPDVTAGWVRAITLAQRRLRDGKADIDVPILLMRSDKSVTGSRWDESHNHADGVLDVNDIRKYGLQLGPDVTSVCVIGGLHDLVLSSLPVRTALYRYMFNWLARNDHPAN